MSRIAKSLSEDDVNQLFHPGNYAIDETIGLYFRISVTGSRVWMLQVQFDGHRCELELGQYRQVKLTEARKRAVSLQESLRVGGVRPIEIIEDIAGAGPYRAKRTVLDVDQLETPVRPPNTEGTITFREAADHYYRSQSVTWGEKRVLSWKKSIDIYASPVLDDVLVSEICVEHVLKVIEERWKTNTETMSKVYRHIKQVLEWSAVHGWRNSENPAVWKGSLDQKLPPRSVVSPVKHYPFMAVDEIPDFLKKLRLMGGLGARCLEFAILTLSKGVHARFVEWPDIDHVGKTWRVNATYNSRSKLPKFFPLVDEVFSRLDSLPRFNDTLLVFPGDTPHQPLSDMALHAVLRRMGLTIAPDSFRRAFREWSRPLDYSTAVKEMALGLIPQSRMSDEQHFLYEQQRLILVQDWVKFVTSSI